MGRDPMMATLGYLVISAGAAFALMVALGLALTPSRVVCVRCSGLGSVEQHAHPINRRVPCGLCDGSGWMQVKP
ncbi:MAG: hypothetical protein ACRDQA_23755 [Nocardioidaceae bacterium]